MTGPVDPEPPFRILAPGEAFRRRPGMYLGDVDDGFAQHAMLWLVVGQAVDEHVRFGTAGHVRIAFEGDVAIVENDGRGLPLDELEPVATQMTFHGGRVHSTFTDVTDDLVGLGIAVVNALSTRFDLQVSRAGLVHVQRYARSVALGPIEVLGPTSRTGTRVTFEPDFTVLPPHAWDVGAIAARARELAALCPPLTFIVDGEAACYPEGLVDHVRHLTRGRRIVDPIHVRGHADGARVEAAIAWVDGDAPARLEGFVCFRRRCSGSWRRGSPQRRARIRRWMRCSRGSREPDGVLSGLGACLIGSRLAALTPEHTLRTVLHP